MAQTKLLTDDDKVAIDAVLDTTPDLEEELARAKAAGLDVSEIEGRFLDSTKKLRGLKTAFFPNG